MSLRISAVGDVFLERDEPGAAFDHVRDVFGASSLVFANLEGVYADDWHRAPSAGADLGDARRPAFLDTDSGRVAVLAYASVFPHGYEARPGWPGLAPMRDDLALMS
jgi:hypothetical protein